MLSQFADLNVRFISLRAEAGVVNAAGTLSCRLGNPAGVFAEWHWDGASLTARNCPFGFQPLFYRELPSGIRISESVSGVLADGDMPPLDTAALSVFLRLGFFLDADTPFLGVRQLPPNSELVWSARSGLHVKEGERPSAPPSGITRQEAIRAYARLFEQAVARSLPLDDRVMVPLSGGRDSRHIALALHALGATPSAYVTQRHHPWRSNEDVRVAALVAGAVGVPHIAVGSPRSFVGNMLRNLAETGFCNLEHAWLLPARDVIVGNSDRTFDGIAGDVMSAGLFNSRELHEAYAAGQLEAVADMLFSFWSHGLRGWQTLVSGDLRSALSGDVARARLLAELTRHAGHHSPARSFYFWNRTRRVIALSPFSLFRGVRSVTPYLDRELWEFLESLPFELTADHEFHTETIRFAYPAFAGIPFEDKGAQVPFRLMDALTFALDFARHAVPLAGSPDVRAGTLLRRCAGLPLDYRTWWGAAVTIYVLALLNRTSSKGAA